MIRFIVCDVEGTLQHDGENRVSEELLSQIPQLKEKGILFAVVSGKSYDELLEIFSPVKAICFLLLITEALLFLMTR